MSWEEIDVGNRIEAETKYVSISKGKKGITLTFPTYLSPVLKNYSYCKALIDAENKLIGLKLELKSGNNCSKLTIRKMHTNCERVSVAFTKQWNTISQKLSLPEIEKSVKYEVCQEKEDFFVIDCNKPL